MIPKAFFLTLVTWSVSLSLSAAEEARTNTPIATINHPGPVQFMTEVLPLFKKSCLACHNASTAKGDLVLETPASILKGGESGPAVVPGKSVESLLLKAASFQTKPFMPPRNNKVEASPLTRDELGLVKLWIDQGATGTVSIALGPVKWQPLPPGLNPINAVALSPDGQYAACGRANQIFIYHVPSGQMVTRLTDPDLVKELPGVADRDFIESLTFSPDGTTLASGSYRIVKLWHRDQPAPQFTLSSDTAARFVAASPDGKWLASAGENNLIHLWDAKGRTIVRTLTNHSAPVGTLEFSKNSEELLSGSADKTVRLWKIADGTLLHTVEAPGAVAAALWLDETNTFAYGGADSQIHIYDRTKNAELKTLSGHSKGITALQRFKPGHILSAGGDGFVRDWNLSEAKEAKNYNHGAAITALAVRPDLKRFASAGGDNVIKLWNVEKGEVLAQLKGDRHKAENATEAERLVAFTKSEVSYHKTTLESLQKAQKTEQEALKKASDAKAAAEKTAEEKEAVAKAAQERKSSADKVLASFAQASKIAGQSKDSAEKLTALLQAEIKSTSERLSDAKANLEKAVKVKDAAYKKVLEVSALAQAAAERATAAEAKTNKNENEIRELKETAKERAAAAEERVDLAAKAKAHVEQLEGAAKSLEALSKSLTAQAGAITESKSAAEKLLAEAKNQEKDGDAKVKASDKALADANKALQQALTGKTNAVDNYEAVVASAKRADDAVTAANKSLEIADATQKAAEKASAAAAAAAKESERSIRTLAFSPDNRLLASGGEDKLIHTWSAENGKAYDTFSSHGSNVVSLTYTMDGTLISAGQDKKILLWGGFENWKLERKIGNGDDAEILIDRVLALDFSRDGQWLATGGGVPSRSGQIKIWNTVDGRLLQELKDPHSDTVFTLDFSADRKFLASGGADKFVRVFDMSSGKLVKSFEGHTHHVLGVSWKRDGRTLASSGADKVVKVWDFLNGEQKKTIEGFNKEITSIHFIDGSNEAIVSSGDSQVKLIREDGNNVRTFGGASDFIQAAAITPDGKLVAAGGQDSVLRIWNGSNGEVLNTFEAPKVAQAQ
jgi:WD40 repeat protein